MAWEGPYDQAFLGFWHKEFMALLLCAPWADRLVMGSHQGQTLECQTKFFTLDVVLSTCTGNLIVCGKLSIMMISPLSSEWDEREVGGDIDTKDEKKIGP